MDSDQKAEGYCYFDSTIRELGVTTITLNTHEAQTLDQQGYLILPNAIDQSWLIKMRQAFENVSLRRREFPESKQSGTRQIPDLAKEDQIFDGIFKHQKVLAAVWQILGRPFKVQQMGGRDPLPGYGQQGLHADWMPRSSPREPFYAATAIWLLDDFTKDNGATRVVPGTHHSIGKIPKAISDPSGQHPDQIFVLAQAGSVLVINGHLWHSGTKNNSNSSRRILQCAFVAIA